MPNTSSAVSSKAPAAGLPSPREARQNRRSDQFVQDNTGKWVFLRTRDGVELEMLCGDAVADQIIRFGAFEEHLCSLFKTLLSEPALVVDLGANIGFFSCLAGKCQPRSTLVTVEPNPMLVPVLRRNLERNGVQATVLPMAIGTEQGTARLTFPENRPARGTLGSLPQSPRFTTMRETEVEVVTWDRIFQACEGRQVKILKMDLEGYDVKVLATMSESQAASVDHIICEFEEKRLAQCQSRRSDLAAVPWLGQFEPWVVDQVAVPVRLNDVSEFPSEATTLWLRRRNLKVS